MIILTIIVAHTILSLPKNILTSMKSASILNLVYVSIIVVVIGYIIYRLLLKQFFYLIYGKESINVLNDNIILVMFLYVPYLILHEVLHSL